MKFEKRKKDLAKWVMSLQSEAVIQRLEGLKTNSTATIPAEIVSLPDSSNATHPDDLIRHTSSKKTSE